ncbi:hypothetical protein VCHA47P369_10048 [Vibrio chagasii]|nr:hypothetical protein VCHA34P114_140049 [Vibrio chagasii]CAH6831377.1 hypothetical protein VCHA36P168_150051 [Vibrio chagasii]CAH7000129.1 hypothetical protein VCHA47P369_10048 [Vibrio chagasii]CAH7101483.1 hypothetical protein VCHA48P435_20052 [Vibrio chagasii]CAH7161723.1 hypothetical protein VCHA52P461_200052 [Vibrio chagasii]
MSELDSDPDSKLLFFLDGNKRLTIPLIPATRPMPNIRIIADAPNSMPPKNASQGIKLITDLSYPQTLI